MSTRPSKHENFLNRAKAVAERCTCMRRKVGAIIVKDGVELSSGYVGAPRNMAHCIDLKFCLRSELNVPSGERYELCRSVHAEQNAIINASRTGVNIVDGIMYISSEKNKNAYPNEDKTQDKMYAPCIICKKSIINVGITKVHMREEGVGEKSFTIEEIKELLREEENEWKKEFSSK